MYDSNTIITGDVSTKLIVQLPHDRVVLLIFGGLILVATCADLYKSRKKQSQAPPGVKDETQGTRISEGIHDGEDTGTVPTDSGVSYPRTDVDVNDHSSLPMVTTQRHVTAPPSEERESAVIKKRVMIYKETVFLRRKQVHLCSIPSLSYDGRCRYT